MSARSAPDDRWTGTAVLKRDIFSTIERGLFREAGREVDATLRRIDQTPWWSRLMARHLFNRECRALTAAASLDGVPALLWVGRQALIRGWIDGVALHIAKPHGDGAYFRSAKALLRSLHRRGICHNDLAKQQNWLRDRDGNASVTDFQLAVIFKRRSKLFRIAAYEDLRHLLKHKQRYAPSLLTPSERRMLERKSVFAHIQLKLVKPVYHLITRRALNFADREGGGLRLVRDAPQIAEAMKSHPLVRDAVIVAYPDRRSGVGLYAFVAAAPELTEHDLRSHIGSSDTPLAPEQIQLTEHLPRDASGQVRSELLQLVALNQIDLIEPLIRTGPEREAIMRIVASRLNLMDRIDQRMPAPASGPKPGRSLMPAAE